MEIDTISEILGIWQKLLSLGAEGDRLFWNEFSFYRMKEAPDRGIFKEKPKSQESKQMIFNY